MTTSMWTHFSLRSIYDMKAFVNFSLEVYSRGRILELLRSYYVACHTRFILRAFKARQMCAKG
jgi:hypothetical protein